MKAPHDRQRRRLPLKVWLPALVILVVAAGAAAWYFIAMPHSEKERQVRDQSSKATRLYQEHQACVKKLDEDFKALDSTNQDAYQKAYDTCEAIRLEQNKAVDTYNQLNQS